MTTTQTSKETASQVFKRTGLYVRSAWRPWQRWQHPAGWYVTDRMDTDLVWFASLSEARAFAADIARLVSEASVA